MINTKLTAVQMSNCKIALVSASGEVVAEFAGSAFFYIVTGFKSADAYKAHHADEPVKFLVWKREN